MNEKLDAALRLYPINLWSDAVFRKQFRLFCACLSTSGAMACSSYFLESSWQCRRIFYKPTFSKTWTPTSAMGWQLTEIWWNAISTKNMVHSCSTYCIMAFFWKTWLWFVFLVSRFPPRVRKKDRKSLTRTGERRRRWFFGILPQVISFYCRKWWVIRPNPIQTNRIESNPIQSKLISHIPTNDAASSGAKIERPKYEECAKVSSMHASAVWSGMLLNCQLSWNEMQPTNPNAVTVNTSDTFVRNIVRRVVVNFPCYHATALQTGMRNGVGRKSKKKVDCRV